MIRVIHGYLHAQLEIPDEKGFPRRQPQCHPAHGNFSHGLPVGPKFSNGAAPRREAMRTTRARARAIAIESKKLVRTQNLARNDPKIHFWMDENIDFFTIGLIFIN